MRLLARLAMVWLALPAAAVLAQPAGPSAELQRDCAAAPAVPTQAHDQVTRARCLLAGALTAADRLGEARELARKAMAQGDAGGGLLLYIAFQADPANQALRDGKIDPEAYRQLAARPAADRRGQVEAIEGLAFAAAKGSPQAGLLLAAYFHDTVAPQNVDRMRAMATLLKREGQPAAVTDRLLREANAIDKAAAGTRTSPRSFFEALRPAIAAARAGYEVQTQGRTCADAQLTSVSAGDLQQPQFLPLTGIMVADSYLVQGSWAEYWTFQACDQLVPVKVSFRADGWGGTTSTAVHNKGD